MSSDQKEISATQGAARTAPHPVGAGTAGSAVYVIALSSVAAVGGFLFGFDSGVINGAVDALARAFGTQSAGTGFAVALMAGLNAPLATPTGAIVRADTRSLHAVRLADRH